MRVINLLFIVFCSLPTFAQQMIQGTVVDAEKGITGCTDYGKARNAGFTIYLLGQKRKFQNKEADRCQWESVILLFDGI